MRLRSSFAHALGIVAARSRATAAAANAADGVHATGTAGAVGDALGYALSALLVAALTAGAKTAAHAADGVHATGAAGAIGRAGARRDRRPGTAGTIFRSSPLAAAAGQREGSEEQSLEKESGMGHASPRCSFGAKRNLAQIP